MGAKEQEIYDLYRDVVTAMVTSRRRHRDEHPDCGAAPLCLGTNAMLALSLSIADDPMFSVHTLLTCVGELSAALNNLAEAERRLEVQRAMTQDAVKACDEMERRAKVAEESEQALAAELDDERAAHGKTMAELTQWEEATEHLAPTTPAEEP